MQTMLSVNLNRQIRSHRMEIYHRNQGMELHEENNLGSKQNCKSEKELIKMLVIKTFQEVEELNRICCSEAERAQELLTDYFCPTRIAGKPVQ